VIGTVDREDIRLSAVMERSEKIEVNRNVDYGRIISFLMD